VPGASPKTDIGSFEILSDSQRRDVYIYWQHIPEYYHNGDNFDYKIVVEDDGGEAQYVQFCSFHYRYSAWELKYLVQYRACNYILILLKYRG
jgi:hypothetical protein